MAAPTKAQSHAPRNSLDPTYVQKILTYKKHTGVFIWKPRVWANGRVSTRDAGKIAGTLDTKGHRQISINGVAYMAHCLAWAIVKNEWPAHPIDHENGLPDDNRWKNLRKCTDSQNKANQKKYVSNSAGLKGVSYRPERKNPFVARITIDHKTYSLGGHDTLEKAHQAYQNAAKNLYGKFARFE